MTSKGFVFVCELIFFLNGKFQTNCLSQPERSLFVSFLSTSEPLLNESFSDEQTGEGDSPTTKAGRMTRLRARGGVRDRPPIIDDDDEDMFRVAPIVIRAKRKAGRKPAAEKVAKEPKEIVEKVVDKERDVTHDESSLYYIVRHSKSPITVTFQAFQFCPH